MYSDNAHQQIFTYDDLIQSRMMHTYNSKKLLSYTFLKIQNQIFALVEYPVLMGL